MQNFISPIQTEKFLHRRQKLLDLLNIYLKLLFNVEVSTSDIKH